MAPRQRKRKKHRQGGLYRPPPRRGPVPQDDFDAPGQDREREPRAAPRRGQGRAEPDRPPAPWGRFPLVELVVAVALVLLVAGFFVQGNRGVVLIVTGITLGSLAGLELAVREHFSGYRSHSTVLAGAPAVLVLAAGTLSLPATWSRGVSLTAAIAVFAVSFYFLREAFKRRSGGVGFR